MTRRTKIALTLAAVVCGITIAVAHFQRHVLHLGSRQSAVSLVDQASLKALPHKNASSADTSHLGPGLLPPTNTWFSGLALQKTPQAVYPMPNSFLAKTAGFELGLPKVTSTATEIDGEHTPGVSADLAATGFRVTRYDKLSVSLTYQKQDTDLGTLTVTEGSPFLFYRAASNGTLTLSDINPADVLEHNDHYLRYNRAGHTYAVTTTNAKVTMTATAATVQVAKGDLVSLYSLPSASDSLRAYAQNDITSVAVSHQTSGSNVSTNFEYHTSTGKPTVFAALPYMNVSGPTIASYQSIWGTMKTTAGTHFTTTVSAVTPSNQLALSKLTADQKSKLVTSLQTDVASTKIDQNDSYFAGKQLARAANLLSVAEQLHETDSVTKLKAILTAAFAARLGNDYFYYDTTLKGVAASHAAFGSEDFNDHHFHYGYWLYAGSIMAQYDSAFLKAHQSQLNLLAADIASYQTGSDFPLYRNYDPYAGHSWAAGLAPFADGNNQESSSEAIHAWNGVSLWGQVTKNSALQQTGQWMLAFEANTATRAWRSVDVSDATLKGYSSPVSSLNFGGKRTYSTFFSAEPAAKLGIQLIPMDPSMVSFAGSQTAITQTIAASIQNDNYNVALGDYVLMYLSLSDPTKASSLAAKQTVIDDGNSQTYLKAFIDSQQAH